MSWNKKCSKCNFTSYYAVKKIVNRVIFLFEILKEGRVYWITCTDVRIYSAAHRPICYIYVRTYSTCRILKDKCRYLTIFGSII